MLSGPGWQAPKHIFKKLTYVCVVPQYFVHSFTPMQSWNPMWSVATIIQGVQSFMASDDLTTGGMKATDSERRKLAAASIAYNEKMFPQLFGGDVVGAMKLSDQMSKDALEKSASDAAQSSGGSSSAGGARTAAAARRRRQQQQKEQQSGENDGETETEVEGDVENNVGESGDNDVDDGGDDNNDDEVSKQLNPEEIEKRRKKNAKKRAKQKAKKQASAEESGRST